MHDHIVKRSPYRALTRREIASIVAAILVRKGIPMHARAFVVAAALLWTSLAVAAPATPEAIDVLLHK